MAISIPNSFSAGTPALSAEVNENFNEIADKALDKTGDTITGNISVNNGITIDGRDLSADLDQAVKTTSSPTFAGVTSTLTGKVINAVATKNTTYTAVPADHVLLCDGTFTVTLYAASGNSGRMLEIKNIGSGVITVDGNLGETIDGAATLTIDGQYFSYTLICDGSNWHVI